MSQCGPSALVVSFLIYVSAAEEELALCCQLVNPSSSSCGLRIWTVVPVPTFQYCHVTPSFVRHTRPTLRGGSCAAHSVFVVYL